jgi:outer membrane receptor for ferrienterochelin and colicins
MHIVKTPFRLTLLAAAVAVPFAAHAQQAAAPLASDDKIQRVDVKGAADAYDPRRDDTASKIVVNHDEIVKYGDTSVLDVLKRVPGVTVSGGGGRAARSACAGSAPATRRCC